MKKRVFILTLVVFILAASMTGCAKSESYNDLTPEYKKTAKQQSENDALQYSSAHELPLYFEDAAQLIETINRVKKNDGSIIEISSKYGGMQTYNAKTDEFRLADLNEFYAPGYELDNMQLIYITVKREYISFAYGRNGTPENSFKWLREMAPEVAMNLDAFSEQRKDVKQDGINYFFLEWFDPYTNAPTGYGVHWIKEGRAYQASVIHGYSEREILDFCTYVTIPAK